MMPNNHNIKIIHCLSNEESSWEGEKGYINQYIIEKYLDNYNDKIWEQKRYNVMLDALRLKFNQNEKKLIIM